MILEIIQAPIASWARGCQTMGPAGFRVEGFGKKRVRDLGSRFWVLGLHVPCLGVGMRGSFLNTALLQDSESSQLLFQQVPKLRTPA